MAAGYGTHGLFTSHQPTQLTEYSTVSNRDLTSAPLVSSSELHALATYHSLSLPEHTGNTLKNYCAMRPTPYVCGVLEDVFTKGNSCIPACTAGLYIRMLCLTYQHVWPSFLTLTARICSISIFLSDLTNV